jgi:hypothetical protein
MRLLQPSDTRDRAAYPLLTFIKPFERRRCVVALEKKRIKRAQGHRPSSAVVALIFPAFSFFQEKQHTGFSNCCASSAACGLTFVSDFIRCTVCQIRVAEWVTIGDPMADEHKTLYCQPVRCDMRTSDGGGA